MYEIITKEMLTPTICRMKVYAPRLAASALPGQFLIVRATENGERIPLTISDYDKDAGTVTIVTQQIGASSSIPTLVWLVPTTASPLRSPFSLRYFASA